MTEAETEPRGAVVYRLLRKAIIEQSLLPGTRLPEDTIGEQFGVSRTIVRSALVRLQSEGLVETKPNRGAFVATPSFEEARQIFEVRHCLEREVIRRLVARVSMLGLDALDTHVAREGQLKNKDGPGSVRLAGEFHILLAELAGNAILARYVAEIVSRCSLILAIYGRSHSSDCAVDEHRRIIEAVRAGDAQAAMAVMSHHLGAVEERARPTVDAPPDLETVLAHYGKEAGV